LTLDELLRSAASGDQAAWDTIVTRFSGLVWATARAYRLSREDAADVAQTTWLRLVEHLDRIREPERLGAWLAVVAGRESQRVRDRGSREQPSGEIDLFESPSDDAFDRLVLDRDRDGILWRAFATLSEECRALLRLVVAADDLTYKEIGEALDMPIGSIGPTRGRCLDDLRMIVDPEELGVMHYE
jgi:RNA polymerase sigma factor (sigma-70 family)